MASALLHIPLPDDPAATSLPGTRSPGVIHSIGLFLLLAAGLGLGLFIISISLLELGVLSDFNVNFGARAMLAYDGAPPKLENIGGIYPPIPFFLVLVFRNAFIASSMAGGIVLAAILSFIGSLRQRGLIGRMVEFLWIISYIAIPQTLYILTQRIDLCLTICAFILTMWSLRKAELYGRTYHLTICGLGMTLLYLCDTTTLPLCLLFAPFIAWRGRKTHNSIISVLLLTYLPLAFFSLVQHPLSLLITGIADPFTQWKSLLLVSQGINLPEARPAEGSLVSAAVTAGQRLADNWLLLMPWVAGWGIVLLRGGLRLLVDTSKYLVAPLVYCIYSLYLGTGIFECSSAALLIFPAMTVLLGTRDFYAGGTPQRRGTALLAMAMLLGTIGGWLAMLHSPSDAERYFAQAIVYRQPEQRWNEFKPVLDALHLETGNGLVLMDTERNLPLVFFSAAPRRFLLPYQLDYEIGLSLPASYVEYVVVYADPRYDGVVRRHPDTVRGVLPGFECVAREGKRIVFRRAKAEN